MQSISQNGWFLMNIKTGDTVQIKSERYIGEAIITYIDESMLYQHSKFPIQCKIPKENLVQFEDHNHGQQILRFNLKEIVGEEEQPKLPDLQDFGQMDLFG